MCVSLCIGSDTILEKIKNLWNKCPEDLQIAIGVIGFVWIVINLLIITVAFWTWILG